MRGRSRPGCALAGVEGSDYGALRGLEKVAWQSTRSRALSPPLSFLWLPGACYNVITTEGKGSAKAVPLARGGNDKRGVRGTPSHARREGHRQNNGAGEERARSLG